MEISNKAFLEYLLKGHGLPITRTGVWGQLCQWIDFEALIKIIKKPLAVKRINGCPDKGWPPLSGQSLIAFADQFKLFTSTKDFSAPICSCSLNSTEEISQEIQRLLNSTDTYSDE